MNESIATANRPNCGAPPATFYSAEDYNPADSVGYLMRRILSAVAAAVERELASTGLTHAQWIPLFKMHVNAGATVAELARQCEMDAGSMTRLLDRLEAKGLCRRERSSEDRRVVNLALTPQGREVAEQIPGALSRVQNAYLAGFERDEWLLLKSFLGRILDNAQPLGCAEKKS
ncbi:MarR family winged helix-turn-helix transcriptional regulator [Pseudorhodoferax sp. Leaf267]|uniref:MarR family winged helix-turn-helix transcriptional regulator n=1 Tax=Pseudorhodoferax sp. Leaf267 TaxID=1736316 RepID=UPI0006F2AABE|nr:MarR family transcriptional regulator [Pseudorhodoferax sp. Leaf267]KQP22512.1 MarR family transcriptional regulator [Pseudorhodoferax sp. Leaf267]